MVAMKSESVSMETATVKVQTLTVGERQVTAGIIRQVPVRHRTVDDPAPWVRFSCSVLSKCRADATHAHFLWVSAEGDLCRSMTYKASYDENDIRMWEAAEAAPFVYAAGMR